MAKWMRKPQSRRHLSKRNDRPGYYWQLRGQWHGISKRTPRCAGLPLVALCQWPRTPQQAGAVSSSLPAILATAISAWECSRQEAGGQRLGEKKRLSSQGLGQVIPWREGEPSFAMLALIGGMWNLPCQRLTLSIGCGNQQMLAYSTCPSNRKQRWQRMHGQIAPRE